MSDTLNVTLSVGHARLILAALALMEQRYEIKARSGRSDYTMDQLETFQEAADEARALFNGLNFILAQQENDR